jgi:hypothetical protein
MMSVGDQRVDCVGTAATFMDLNATHAGAVVGDGALPSDLEQSLGFLGGIVGEQARTDGYRGPLTIDAIVDRGRRINLLEINARRTTVTHCYSLRRSLFGETRPGAIASCESVRVRGIELDSYARVRCRLRPISYRSDSRSGVLVSHFTPQSKSDRDARLSLVAVDRDANTAVTLLREAFRCLAVEVPAPVQNVWRQVAGLAGGIL